MFKNWPHYIQRHCPYSVQGQGPYGCLRSLSPKPLPPEGRLRFEGTRGGGGPQGGAGGGRGRAGGADTLSAHCAWETRWARVRVQSVGEWGWKRDGEGGEGVQRKGFTTRFRVGNKPRPSTRFPFSVRTVWGRVGKARPRSALALPFSSARAPPSPLLDPRGREGCEWRRDAWGSGPDAGVRSARPGLAGWLARPFARPALAAPPRLEGGAGARTGSRRARVLGAHGFSARGRTARFA